MAEKTLKGVRKSYEDAYFGIPHWTEATDISSDTTAYETDTVVCIQSTTGGKFGIGVSPTATIEVQPPNMIFAYVPAGSKIAVSGTLNIAEVG